MMDNVTPFERTLRTVVAVVLLMVPATYFLSLLLAIAQTEVPSWFKGEFGFLLAILETIAVFLSVFLCWRLPDFRRWFAVAMDLLIVIVTIVGLQVQFSNLQGQAQATRIAEVRASSRYQRVEARLQEARENLRLLTARTAIIPAEHMTQANNNAREIRLVTTEVGQLSDQLNQLEASALATKPSTSVSLLAVLSSPDSQWLQILLTVAFAVGNHINAILLLYHPRLPEVRSMRVIKSGRVRKLGVGHLSQAAEIYLGTASRLGENGKVAGYRAVATALGVSPAEARKRMEECQVAGRILDRRAVAQQAPTGWWEKLHASRKSD